MESPITHTAMSHNKYTITKNDGTPVDPKARYFVLRVDKPTPECRAAIDALIHFANLVAPHNKKQAEAAFIFAHEGRMYSGDWEAV